jgi:hypothetical protein
VEIVYQNTPVMRLCQFSQVCEFSPYLSSSLKKTSRYIILQIQYEDMNKSHLLGGMLASI